MKALVTYFSQTGNTAKVAGAIYEGIEAAERDLAAISEVEDISDYDLIFCGFPVHAHRVPHSMEVFLEKLPSGTKVALFATHGSLRGGILAVQAFHHGITIGDGLNILGTFGCRGKVRQSVLDALEEKAENWAWVMEARSAAGHPDGADLADAADFARTMITKARAMLLKE